MTRNKQLLSDKNKEPTSLGVHKETGEDIFLKKGRFGPYLQCGKKMKSLPPGVTEDTLTNNIAQQIVSLPTEIGIDSNTKLPIIKDIGRYGPYLKCGTTNRKISSPDNVLDITSKRAEELLSQSPSQKAILKELGKNNNQTIQVKDGRYGTYVTNGKINVTLPKEIDYQSLDLDTAIELINQKAKKKTTYKRK